MLGLGGCSPVFARTIFYRIFLAMVVKPRWGRHFLWHTQSFWAAICDETILRFWRLQGNRRLCCALRQAVSIFGNLGQWGPREEFGPLTVWWIDLARRLKKNKMRELSELRSKALTKSTARKNFKSWGHQRFSKLTDARLGGIKQWAAALTSTIFYQLIKVSSWFRRPVFVCILQCLTAILGILNDSKTDVGATWLQLTA